MIGAILTLLNKVVISLLCENVSCVFYTPVLLLHHLCYVIMATEAIYIHCVFYLTLVCEEGAERGPVRN